MRESIGIESGISKRISTTLKTNETLLPGLFGSANSNCNAFNFSSRAATTKGESGNNRKTFVTGRRTQEKKPAKFTLPQMVSGNILRNSLFKVPFLKGLNGLMPMVIGRGQRVGDRRYYSNIILPFKVVRFTVKDSINLLVECLENIDNETKQKINKILEKDVKSISNKDFKRIMNICLLDLNELSNNNDMLYKKQLKKKVEDMLLERLEWMIEEFPKDEFYFHKVEKYRNLYKEAIEKGLEIIEKFMEDYYENQNNNDDSKKDLQLLGQILHINLKIQNWEERQNWMKRSLEIWDITKDFKQIINLWIPDLEKLNKNNDVLYKEKLKSKFDDQEKLSKKLKEKLELTLTPEELEGFYIMSGIEKKLYKKDEKLKYLINKVIDSFFYE